MNRLGTATAGALWKHGAARIQANLAASKRSAGSGPTGHSLGHTGSLGLAPGRSLGHTPGRNSGRNFGRNLGRSLGRNPGHISGLAPGACPRLAPGTLGSATGTRSFSSSAALSHNHIHKPKEGEELHVTFISKDGSQQTFEVAEGDNILDIAQSYNLDMEGACGGSCACSTCHVIIDPEFYDKIEEPDDDENDMLDLAFGLTETSRLGCQIKMTKELDGIRIALPAMTRNLQSRDFN